MLLYDEVDTALLEPLTLKVYQDFMLKHPDFNALEMRKFLSTYDL